MKRISRGMNIFSISAIDLFAAAMGAFIIISVILFPYHLKTQDSKLAKQIDVLKQQKETLEKQSVELQSRIKDLLEKIAVLDQPDVENTQKIADMEQQNQLLQNTIAGLEQQLEAFKTQTDASKQSDDKVQQKIAALLQEKKRLQAHNTSSQKENKDLKTRIKKLNQTIEAMRPARDQVQSLEKKNRALQKALEQSIKFALLGIATRAESFVVVVDMSASMVEYAASMKRTLEQLTQPLYPQITFQMVGYQDVSKNVKLHYWPKSRRPVSMNRAGKQAVKTFASQLSRNFDGQTPTHAALREALRYNAEALILITDGQPTDSQPAEIIRDITFRNNGQKEIHCVALGSYHRSQRGIQFLQGLAEKNKGVFVGVSN